MRGKPVASFFLILTFSCRTHSVSDRAYADGNPDKVYKLRLNPQSGSKYEYTIANVSDIRIEAEDKKIENKNTTTVGMTYTINKDSAGNLVLDLRYNKIHQHTKNGDTETDLDADRSGESSDPAERLFGVLKGASIQAVIGPKGETKSVKGYDEIRNKILESFTPSDTYGKTVAAKQWDEKVKQNLVKNSIQQLFAAFPDSAVRVGNKWKLNTVQDEGVAMTINSFYTLKDIHDGIALITSIGDVSSNNQVFGEMGNNFTAELKGNQKGEFEVETTTGILLNSKVETDVKGALTSMGREIPISLHSEVKLEGRKLK